MCEFLRAGYTTLLRPFRDSIETVKIRWYRALPNAPCLGLPSAITSLNWDDTPWRERAVGEVYGAARPFSPGEQIPLALGAHVCGTPQDFAEGEHFDPSLPPTIYATNGLPVCCNNPPKRASDGGVILGGTAGVGVTYAATSSGGAVAGGIAGVNVSYAATSSGGAVAGGTAGVSVSELFCDSYSLDPPLHGQSVLTRAIPGSQIWTGSPPFDVLLVASFTDPAEVSWSLSATGEPYIWHPSGFWDGIGCEEFENAGGGPIPPVTVCCAD